MPTGLLTVVKKCSQPTKEVDCKLHCYALISRRVMGFSNKVNCIVSVGKKYIFWEPPISLSSLQVVVWWKLLRFASTRNRLFFHLFLIRMSAYHAWKRLSWSLFFYINMQWIDYLLNLCFHLTISKKLEIGCFLRTLCTSTVAFFSFSKLYNSV